MNKINKQSGENQENRPKFNFYKGIIMLMINVFISLQIGEYSINNANVTLYLSLLGITSILISYIASKNKYFQKAFVLFLITLIIDIITYNCHDAFAKISLIFVMGIASNIIVFTILGILMGVFFIVLLK